MIRWLLIAFFIFTLLSCSIARCIAACIVRGCLGVFVFFYVWAGRTLFFTKTESTNRNFQVCSRKQVRSWILILQLAISWTDVGKIFASLSKNWFRKRMGIAKHNMLTRKRKNLQRFLKTSVFLTFIQSDRFLN